MLIKNYLGVLYQNINKLFNTHFVPPVPWITYDARRFLDSVLSGDMVGFEYGSGGSTLYLSSRLKHLTSVEHDKIWYEKVSRYIKSKKIKNVDYRLVEPAYIGETTLDYSDPDSFASINSSKGKIYEGMIFKDYVGVLEEFPESSLDFILIDGRARPSCIQLALRKIKKDGIICVDNSERAYYWTNINLGSYIKKNFYGYGPYNHYKWQTTILLNNEKLVRFS